MSFKSLKLWKSKLEYVKQVRTDIYNFPTAHHDHDQAMRYRQMIEDIERKVKEYEDLINYLEGVKE